MDKNKRNYHKKKRVYGDVKNSPANKKPFNNAEAFENISSEVEVINDQAVDINIPQIDQTDMPPLPPARDDNEMPPPMHIGRHRKSNHRKHMKDKPNKKEISADNEIPAPEILEEPEVESVYEADIIGDDKEYIETSDSSAADDDAAVIDQNEPVEIIGIRFKKSGKIYYFDPSGLKFSFGESAIVETARVIEFGTIALGNRMVSGKEIVPPLRKVIRAATEEDIIHHKENETKEIEAFNVCVEKIAEHKLSMKLIDVEYTFDNNKLLFYFTHEGRVDFRDLVKDLASIFRTRIELRQIGIRDEAKIMGGLGVCGRPFCCHAFLGDFVQVSIKMAKEQNLSLNSSKISGSCGRLMCCLRYEYDVYEEELRKTPRVDSIVETPDGDAVVIETMPLAGMVKVRFQQSPEQPPKVYHREDCKIKGFIKREESEEDGAEDILE